MFFPFFVCDFLSFFDSSDFNLLGIPLVHIFIEFFLILLIIIVYKTGRLYPNESRLNLTKEEEDLLIQEWKPTALVADDILEKFAASDYAACDLAAAEKPPTHIIEGKITRYININNNICLNFATNNFLDFVGNDKIEKNALKCISKYAVGTCGPRGFLGTTDIHLKLEKMLADFCGTEHCIIYSYGFSTFSSAICSYCKKQDIIFADEGVSLPIQIGMTASRAKVFHFKHNDMVDLEKLLKDVQRQEINDPKKFRNIRKYIVIEGVYQNYGDIPDLRKIIEFKYTYKARILVEESFSMGVLGKTGRGIVEHFDLDVSDIDLRAFSFENAFASCGGACVGSTYVIDHQRLSGLGYCFSASSPTFLCQVVIDELEMIEDCERISNLQKLCKLFKTELDKGLNDNLMIDGSINGPIFHIRFKSNSKFAPSLEKQSQIFKSASDLCLEKKIAVLVPSYLTNKEYLCPKPSIRVSMNCSFTETDILETVQILNESMNKIINCSF